MTTLHSARGGRSRLLVFLPLLALGGCHKASGGARLEASWVGSDTGRFAGAVTSRWCPSARRLEVTAINGDAGFGLTLYPVGDPVAGEYPVLDSASDSISRGDSLSRTDSLVRPSASGATRWFTEQTVAGFQADSGTVSLERKGSRIDLGFVLRMPSIGGYDTIQATGTAKGLVPGACANDSVPIGSPGQ